MDTNSAETTAIDLWNKIRAVISKFLKKVGTIESHPQAGDAKTDEGNHPKNWIIDA